MGTGSEWITVISPDRGHCLLWASFHTYRPSQLARLGVANSTLAKYILSSGRRPLAAKPTIVSIVFLHLLQTLLFFTLQGSRGPALLATSNALDELVGTLSLR